jgi:organic hydroperoxide reductase OsmC/OhrA
MCSVRIDGGGQELIAEWFFVDGARWRPRVKDTGSIQIGHLGATEDAESRPPAWSGGTRVHSAMSSKPRVLEYDVEVDRAGRMTIPGGAQIEAAEGWSPDHLLVAALVRCSIESLTYHARRGGHRVSATGSGHAAVTRRDTDGRFALRDVDVRIDAELTPRASEPEELTAKAERDCFVGASLTVTPSYTWHLA